MQDAMIVSKLLAETEIEILDFGIAARNIFLEQLRKVNKSEDDVEYIDKVINEAITHNASAKRHKLAMEMIRDTSGAMLDA